MAAVELGALALRIADVGGDDVLKKITAVEASAQAVGKTTAIVRIASPDADDTSAKIQRIIQNVEVMGQEVDVSSRKAVEAFRNSSDAAGSYLLSLGATDEQLERIGAATLDVDTRAAQLANTHKRGGDVVRGATPNYRAMALAMSTLSLSMVGADTSARGLIRSSGILAQNLGLALGPGAMASYAVGIGAVITAGVGLYEVLEKVSEIGKPAAEALSHIANLDRISTAKEAYDGYSRTLEQLRKQYDDLTARASHLDPTVPIFGTGSIREVSQQIDNVEQQQREAYKRLIDVTRAETKQLAAARLSATIEGRQAENAALAAADQVRLSTEAASYATGKLSLDQYYADRLAIIEKERAREVAALQQEQALKSRAIPGETPAEAEARIAQAKRINQQIEAVDAHSHEQIIREIDERRQKREALDRQILGFETREAETTSGASRQKIEAFRLEAREYARLLVQRGESEASAYAKSQAWLDQMIRSLDPLRRRFFETMRALDESGTATAKAVAAHLAEELAKNGGVIDVKLTLHAEALSAMAQNLDDMFAHLAEQVADTFADALGAGFAAIGSGGNFFKAFGKTLLAGLGQIFMQMGKALLVYGATMLGLLPALMNPFTSGPAALAAGAALIALGGLLGGIASGHASSSAARGGSSYSSSATTPPAIQVPLGPRATPIGAQGYSVTTPSVSLPSGNAGAMPKPVNVFVTSLGRFTDDEARKLAAAVDSSRSRGRG